MVAESYAPQPTSSILMYVYVGVALAVLGLASFGQFYNIDIISHPVWTAPIIVLTILVAISLRMSRSRRHNRAHRIEYERIKVED